MKHPRLFSGLVAGGLLIAATVPALAAEPQKQMSAEEQKAMEGMMKAMTPGAPHQQLAEMAGDFTMHIRMWQDPSAPPEESTGKATREMVLGGRYLLERVKAEMMGMPFEGLGLTTYNNVTSEYENLWIDNMSTSMCMGSGPMQGNEVAMNAAYTNAMTWKKDTAKSVMHMVDKDHQTLEWKENRGGTWVKSMEIEYVRAGKAGETPAGKAGETPAAKTGGGW